MSSDMNIHDVMGVSTPIRAEQAPVRVLDPWAMRVGISETTTAPPIETEPWAVPAHAAVVVAEVIPEQVADAERAVFELLAASYTMLCAAQPVMTTSLQKMATAPVTSETLTPRPPARPAPSPRDRQVTQDLDDL